MVLNKPLESIQESDLQALVDNQVTERKTTERAFPNSKK